MALPIEFKFDESAGKSSLPAVFEAANLETLYKQVEAEVSAEVPDVETVEGRKRIKSLAANVASSKTAIDKPIRDYLRAIKEQPKLLEKNARESCERFDALKAKLLAPLEAAQAKQDAILARLAEILRLCSDVGTDAAMARSMASEAEAVDLAAFWPELAKKAKTAKEDAVSACAVTVERLEREEAQAAELERLRLEAAAREQADRDRKIAEEAAERARLAAEQRAREEREAVERRAVEAKQREEAAKLEAERQRQLAEQAEARRKADAEAAEQRRLEAEANTKRQAQEAAQRAAEAERQRLAAEAAEAERQAKAREADKNHRIAINRAALTALVAETGLTEEQGKAVIRAIGQRLIPAVSINY